ncbi:hypothetical protein B0H11DRAFT_2430929 [Mycena galericulata]|nr:hypothetical protein B0H11DRAFT_2430929 [Mycena galericulata]
MSHSAQKLEAAVVAIPSPSHLRKSICFDAQRGHHIGLRQILHPSLSAESSVATRIYSSFSPPRRPKPSRPSLSRDEDVSPRCGLLLRDLHEDESRPGVTTTISSRWELVTRNKPPSTHLRLPQFAPPFLIAHSALRHDIGAETDIAPLAPSPPIVGPSTTAASTLGLRARARGPEGDLRWTTLLLLSTSKPPPRPSSLDHQHELSSSSPCGLAPPPLDHSHLSGNMFPSPHIAFYPVLPSPSALSERCTLPTPPPSGIAPRSTAHNPGPLSHRSHAAPFRPHATPPCPLVAPPRPLVAPPRPLVAPPRPLAVPLRPLVAPPCPFVVPLSTGFLLVDRLPRPSALARSPCAARTPSLQRTLVA